VDEDEEGTVMLPLPACMMTTLALVERGVQEAERESTTPPAAPLAEPGIWMSTKYLSKYKQ
jgi:hypothetical protein